MSVYTARPRAVRAPSLLRGYYVGLIALLYLPLGVLFLFSINANATLSFPLQGLTLGWYEKLFESEAVLRAARNSLIVAAGSSFVATALGTTVALLATRYQFRSKGLLIALAVLPLIVPFVVLAVALFLLFEQALNVDRSLWTVGVAHTIVALPYVLLIVVARLAGFDPHLEEAAMDLGAAYPTVLRRITLPIIAPAMLSAWLTAFTVSFDEFALALFLAGTEPTFPVYLFSQLRFANRLPIMILAVLPLIVPFVVLAVALFLLFEQALNVDRSLWTVGVAHTIVALPYVLLIVVARLAGFDPHLEEAAMDLGAAYPTVLRRITLPIIAPAMLAAWLTAFTVSFDEFALALFLAGTEPTFPVYLFSQLRFANRLPIMIALAVLLMIGTLTLVFIAERIRRAE